MKHDIEFIIIPLNNNDNKVIEQVNLPQITATTNIYCCPVNLICKLLQLESLPIKNKRIGVTNILDFLKWADTKIDKQKQSNGKYKTSISIHWKEFETYFSRDRYLQYIELLKELEVMALVPYRDNQYSKIGERSNLYRLYNNYIGDETCIVIAPNKCYGSMNIEGKHNSKLINTIKSIDIDYRSAITAEIENHHSGKVDTNQLRMRLNKLFSLNGERFIKYGNKVNRVYHSLSNLSKISREFLHINGVKFNNIDIRNCQPLLLCYYLIKNNLPIDADYITDCEAGSLYERFYKKTGNKAKDDQAREAVKEGLYKSIYFDFKSDHALNLQFANTYPQTYWSLSQIANNEETLASILQNSEAEIFNVLSPESSKYYFTLFDAIYFTSVLDIAPIANSIRTKFAEMKLTPRLKLNDLELI